MTTVDTIMEMFAVAGKAAYYGEDVSQTEHALQCAHLARGAGGDDELIVAALLHDIGHLLCGLPENAAKYGVDDAHEDIGAAWLEGHFGAAVYVPVRLHVPAKRYLCTVDPTYEASLSAASKLSLQLQGGRMPSNLVRQFEQSPHFRAAVELRRWDDAAKFPGLAVPGLEEYRGSLRAALKLGGQEA